MDSIANDRLIYISFGRFKETMIEMIKISLNHSFKQ